MSTVIPPATSARQFEGGRCTSRDKGVINMDEITSITSRTLIAADKVKGTNVYNPLGTSSATLMTS